MPKNKKKWIDKKNAVTFHLVHRSQQDPLTADENAPQKVLVPATSAQAKSKKDKEEEIKYGIYFDDGYNYLQHLKDANTNATLEWQVAPAKPAKEYNIRLPSSVFASEVEEDVGLLNRAAPKSGLCLDLDPDVVAAMDEDFNFEDPDNMLEDDFVLKANASGDEMLEDDFVLKTNASGDEMSEEENEETSSSRMGDLSEDELDLEETKSRITQYSMSSSVLPRNDQLKLLDARFEQMYAKYDESESDYEEDEGVPNHFDDMILKLSKEEKEDEHYVPDPEASKYVRYESDSEEEVRFVPVDKKIPWTCETILSTYSNIYNHPKIIEEPPNPKSRKIKVNARTGMPAAENRLTAKNLAALGAEEAGGVEARGAESVRSALSLLSIRDKDETAEEKRARKAAFKQFRRERRGEKKLNRSAFMEEEKLQKKNTINSRVNNVAVHF